MDKANGINTPMISRSKLSKTNYVEGPTLYRFIVGALHYATLTRLEISFSINKVCQFLSQPLEEHWNAVKRILRYLIQPAFPIQSFTLPHGFVQPASPIQSFTSTWFCDAD